MSTLFLSGCYFSFWDGGIMVQKNEKQTFKLGSISTDMMMDNEINDYADKQRRNEDLKDQDFIIGVRFERKF